MPKGREGASNYTYVSYPISYLTAIVVPLLYINFDKLYASVVRGIHLHTCSCARWSGFQQYQIIRG